MENLPRSTPKFNLLSAENGKMRKVMFDDLTLGETYSFLAVITAINQDTVEDFDGFIEVTLNNDITACIKVNSKEKLKLVYERVLEVGIFVCTVLEKAPNILVECQSIIYGSSPVPTA